MVVDNAMIPSFLENFVCLFYTTKMNCGEDTWKLATCTGMASEAKGGRGASHGNF